MRAARLSLAGAGLLLAGLAPTAAAQLPVDLDVPGLDSVEAASQHDVEVVDDDYEPEVFETEAGATVVWEHTGSNPHTVTADDGSFDSHEDCGAPNFVQCMQNGDTHSEEFPEPGTYRYYCKIHGGPGGEGMSGVIEVSASGDDTTDTTDDTDTTDTTTGTEDGTGDDASGVAGETEGEAGASQALPTTGPQAALALAGTALLAASAVLRRLGGR